MSEVNFVNVVCLRYMQY